MSSPNPDHPWPEPWVRSGFRTEPWQLMHTSFASSLLSCLLIKGPILNGKSFQNWLFHCLTGVFNLIYKGKYILQYQILLIMLLQWNYHRQERAGRHTCSTSTSSSSRAAGIKQGGQWANKQQLNEVASEQVRGRTGAYAGAGAAAAAVLTVAVTVNHPQDPPSPYTPPSSIPLFPHYALFPPLLSL